MIIRLLTTMLCLNIYSTAFASADNLTRGVSEFLVDRANDNNFYMFENYLKNDDDLACYFPKTFEYIKNGDLKILLQANELWEESIEADLESLVAKAIAFKIRETHDLSKIAIDATNEYLELSEYLYIIYKGKKYELNVLPLNQAHPVVNQLNKYYFGFLDFRSQLLALNKYLSKFEDICKAPSIKASEFQIMMVNLKESLNKYSTLIRYIKKNGSDLRVNLQKLNVDCLNGKSSSNACLHRENMLNEFLSRRNGDLNATVKNILRVSETLRSYAVKASSYNSQSAKVVLAFRKLPKNNFAKNIDLHKLKRNAMFFAQLADAESSESIGSILKEYTLPSVSFFVKREDKKIHLLISSYLGLAIGAGLEKNNAIGEKNGQSIIAPIGLELSYGDKRYGAFSVMASIFDFGYPISLKLNGLDEKVDFSQVVAPSLFLTYGLKNQPLLFGVSYQKGRKNQLADRNDDLLFLFVAYDMPLFTLY